MQFPITAGNHLAGKFGDSIKVSRSRWSLFVQGLVAWQRIAVGSSGTDVNEALRFLRSGQLEQVSSTCLLYTSDAADE